jgi:hypothetical protein
MKRQGRNMSFFRRTSPHEPDVAAQKRVPDARQNIMIIMAAPVTTFARGRG